MALLSFDEEMERARPLVPFSNGYEYGCWSSIWCEECVNEPTCPLLLVSLHEVTPGPWEDRSPGELNRYHCHEFQQVPTERVDLDAQGAPVPDQDPA